MVKAVFLDFYETLYFHRRTLEENLRRIVARYGVELNWERFGRRSVSSPIQQCLTLLPIL